MGLTSLVGCSDYLDSDYLFDERMTIEDVFSNRDYTNRWLARGYAYLSNGYLQDVCSKRDYPFNFADDMYYGDGGYDKWKSGHYSESGVNNSSSGIWKNAYLGIRQVAIFLNNIDKNKEFTEEEIIDFKGQAHFLRAYYYWLMLRAFGPIPIIPDEGVDYTKEYDELAYPRNSYDECVEYITGELLKAAGQLPLQRSVQEVLRPTRGAALALRAKILLYAASPLFNGKAPEVVSSALVNKDGKRLLPETYDESKWAKAAAAAKDVMDLNIYGIHVAYFNSNAGDIAYPATIVPPHDDEFSDQSWPNGWKNIDPFQSYREMFDGSIIVSQNEELIFTRGKNQSRESVDIMVVHQLPRNGAGGYGSQGMTQKQCDAYYMNDGTNCPGMNDMYKEFDGYKGRYDSRPRAEGYVKTEELANYPELGPLGTGVSKQYVQREPRFYAWLGFHQGDYSSRLANGQPIQIDTRDPDKQGYNPAKYNRNHLVTGFAIQKFLDPNTQLDLSGGGGIPNRAYPLIRLADLYLMLAECQANLSSDGKSDTYATEALKNLNAVHQRAGLKAITKEDLTDMPLMEWIKNERYVEFYAEGQRYFDVRRWVEGGKYLAAGKREGLRAEEKGLEYDEFRQRIKVNQPYEWNNRQYILPIYYVDVNSNPQLVQAPGYGN